MNYTVGKKVTPHKVVKNQNNKIAHTTKNEKKQMG